jgi:hypothetical protein
LRSEEGEREVRSCSPEANPPLAEKLEVRRERRMRNVLNADFVRQRRIRLWRRMLGLRNGIQRGIR